MQIVSNGRRNVRQRDGRPLAMGVTEGLRELGVPLVRTYQYATHSVRAGSGLPGKPDQVCCCTPSTATRKQPGSRYRLSSQASRLGLRHILLGRRSGPAGHEAECAHRMLLATHWVASLWRPGRRKG